MYSRELKWQPLGDQAETFPLGIGPVDEDILIAKLAPSQKIEAILHCRKGIGKDHAKYSPVSGCFYRHLTTFELSEDHPLTGEEIEKLKICFPKGHFKFPDDQMEDDETADRLHIINPRLETSSELTFMSCPSLEKKIQFSTSDNVLACKYLMSSVDDSCIDKIYSDRFTAVTVESIGMVPANDLVLNAIDILKSKCSRFQKVVSKQRKL